MLAWLEESQNTQIYRSGHETPLLVLVWPKGVSVATRGARGDTVSCAWWHVRWLGAIGLP